MPILTQKAALLAKVETTSGTAISTSGATDAILVSEPMWSIEAEEIIRAFTRGDMSTHPSVYTARRATLSFKTELRGSGTAAIAPDWAVLLRGCGFSATAQSIGTPATITAAPAGAVRAGSGMTSTFTTSGAHGLLVGQWVTVAGATAGFNGSFMVLTVPTSTTFTVSNPGVGSATGGGGTATLMAGALYAPQTDNMDTLTMRLYWDGILHTLTGTMGTWTLTAEAGGIASIEWTFTGTYNTPSLAAIPAQTLQSTIPPIVGSVDLAYPHTAGFTTLYSASMSIDMGNQIAVRKDMNSVLGMHSVYISGRTPTGNFTPEVDAALSARFFADWEASTVRSISAEFGATLGNEVNFVLPAAQVTGISYTDRDNIRAYDISLGLRRSTSGNDEITLFFP